MLTKLIDKYKNISPAVKASVAFTICSVVQRGIQIITTPVFTRMMSTEQFGEYNLYTTWLSIIMIFATLHISTGGYPKGMLKYEDQRSQFVSSMQTLANTVTIVVFTVYIVARDFWNELLGLPQIVMWAIFLELLFSPAFSLWAVRQRFEYKYRALMVVTLVTAVLNPTIGILAVTSTEEKGIARILSVSMVTACIGLVFYIVNILKGKCLFRWEFWKFALAFNLPLVPHYLSNIVLSSSDRIMIERMFGETQVGMYSLAGSIGMIMLILSESMNAGFSPWAYQKCKEREYQSLSKVAEGLLVLMAVVTLVPVMLGPEVIQILGTAEYLDAVGAIAPIALGNYFIYMYGFFALVEFYHEKPKYVMIATCLAAGSNVILNLLFMPIFGYIAAGYTTAVSYLLLVFVHYVAMKRVCRQEGITESIYNLKHFFVITAALCAAIALFVFSYQNMLLRYGLIVVFSVTIFVKRHTLMALYRGRNK